MLPLGRVVNGHYRITAPIATGGMGAVYRAVDPRLRHEVALKQLTAAPNPEIVRAFVREAKLLTELRHPMLPQVIDFFDGPDGLFLVMEYIDGVDLSDELRDRGRPFPVAQVVSWGAALLEVLSYLHHQPRPVVHRDIKPANLKRRPDGTLMLLDFGLAKGALDGDSGASSLHGYTLNYAPIEQIQREGTTPQSDLFAVGATLYQLLTGAPPIDALKRVSAIAKRQPDPLEPPHELNAEVPGHVSAAIVHMLALYQRERTPDARTALAALTGPTTSRAVTPKSVKIIEMTPAPERPAAATPPWWPAPSGGSALTLPTIAALAGAALGGLLGYLLFQALSGPPLLRAVLIPILIAIGALLAIHALRTSEQRGVHRSELGGSVARLRFRQDGSLLAVGVDGSLRVQDRDGAALLSRVGPVSASSALTCADSANLTAVASDRVIHLIPASAQQAVRQLSGHQRRIRALAFAPDDRTLVSADDDGVLRVWRASDGVLLRTLREHQQPVQSLAFTPNGEVLAAGADDGTVRLWRASDGAPLRMLVGRKIAICQLVFRADSTVLAAVAEDGVVQLWRVADGRPLRLLSGHTGAVATAAFSPTGDVLATAGEDGTVRLWRLRDNAPPQILRGHQSYVSSLAFSPDGRTLVSGGWDGQVILWRLGTQPQPEVRATDGSRVWSVACSGDGQAVAAGTMARHIFVWPLRG